MFDATSEVAVTQAITDLLAGLILVPMVAVLSIIPSNNQNEKKRWIRLLTFLCASCLLGYAAHYWCRSEWSFKFIWIPLYAVMFEAVNQFVLLAYLIRSSGTHPTAKESILLHILSLAVFLPTVLIWLITGTGTIKIFVIYAAIVSLIGFASLIAPALQKKNHAVRIILLALVPLLPTVYVQIKRDAVWHCIWDFNYNGIAHLLIIAGLIILFIASVLRIRQEKS